MVTVYVYVQALALVKRRRSARGDDDDDDDVTAMIRPSSKKLDSVIELQKEVEKLQVRHGLLLCDWRCCDCQLLFHDFDVVVVVVFVVVLCG